MEPDRRLGAQKVLVVIIGNATNWAGQRFGQFTADHLGKLEVAERLALEDELARLRPGLVLLLDLLHDVTFSCFSGATMALLPGEAHTPDENSHDPQKIL
jgi:hypothetical protein